MADPSARRTNKGKTVKAFFCRLCDLRFLGSFFPSAFSFAFSFFDLQLGGGGDDPPAPPASERQHTHAPSPLPHAPAHFTAPTDATAAAARGVGTFGWAACMNAEGTATALVLCKEPPGHAKFWGQALFAIDRDDNVDGRRQAAARSVPTL